MNSEENFYPNPSLNLYENDSTSIFNILGNKTNSRGLVESPTGNNSLERVQKLRDKNQSEAPSKMSFNSGTGFSINNSKKRFLSNGNVSVSNKTKQEEQNESDSYNNKTNLKGSVGMLHSFQSVYEDQVLDSLKDGTSCSLNLNPNKRFKTNETIGFNCNSNHSLNNLHINTSFGENNINISSFGNHNGILSFNNNSNQFLNSNGKLFNDSSIDYLASNYFSGNTNNNLNNNLNSNNNHIHSARLSPSAFDQNKQDPFDLSKHDHFDNHKNGVFSPLLGQPAGQFSKTGNGNLASKKNQNNQNISKDISSPLPGQQPPNPSGKSFSGSTTKPSSLSNDDEDVQEGLFHNESLSVLWGAKPAELYLGSRPQDFSSIEGGLKHHLANSKKLLGESSFYKREQDQQKETLSTYEDDKDGERSSRGLRGLSLKVKQIVVEKGETTYKVVADLLVEELRSQATNIRQEEVLKDEQNIKRRVYDALNVLIASKVIEKRGKTVKSCNSSHLNGRCLQADNWKSVKQIESMLGEKKKLLAQKAEILLDYKKKYLALKNLMQRNQKIEQERAQNQCSQGSVDFLNNNLENMQDLSQKMNLIKQQPLRDRVFLDEGDSQGQLPQNVSSQIIQFPFILAQMPISQDSRVIIKMSKGNNFLKIFSSKTMVVKADLDVLLSMGLQEVDHEFAMQHLKKEFYPSYFTENPFFSQINFMKTNSKQENYEEGNSSNNETIFNDNTHSLVHQGK